MDATNLAPRIECSGVPLKITLHASFTYSASNANMFVVPQIDNAGINGMKDVAEAVSSSNTPGQIIDTGNRLLTLVWTTTPSAGSHLIAPAWTETGANTLTAMARATAPLIWIVEEILRQNTKNNLTTTG
jgi:hypothetical protein